MSSAIDVQRPSWPALTAAVIGGIVTWATRFALGYLLVPAACEVGTWLQHVINGSFALVAAGFLVFSIVMSRREQGDAIRFLLYVGIALNAFFLVAILLEASAVLTVSPCAKGAIP